MANAAHSIIRRRSYLIVKMHWLRYICAQYLARCIFGGKIEECILPVADGLQNLFDRGKPTGLFLGENVVIIYCDLEDSSARFNQLRFETEFLLYGFRQTGSLRFIASNYAIFNLNLHSQSSSPKDNIDG